MNCKILPLVCLLILLVGCEKQKYEDFVEPEPDPINIIPYPDEDDNIDEGLVPVTPNRTKTILSL